MTRSPPKRRSAATAALATPLYRLRIKRDRKRQAKTGYRKHRGKLTP